MPPLNNEQGRRMKTNIKQHSQYNTIILLIKLNEKGKTIHL
jgi:hypothetical protein